MNFLTHLHEIVLLLITIFPGIIIFIIDKIPIFNCLNSNFKYSISLLLVVLLNSILYNDYVLIFLSLIFAIISYGCEYLFNNIKKLSISGIKNEFQTIKIAFFVIIICPFFEEYIYRYYLYKDITRSTNEIWAYFFISILSFLFCHFIKQKEKSIYKLPLAIIECIMFVTYKNIYICIFIHMSFNSLVYAHNLNIYSRKY